MLTSLFLLLLLGSQISLQLRDPSAIVFPDQDTAADAGTITTTKNLPVLTTSTERSVMLKRNEKACEEYLNVLRNVKDVDMKEDCETFYYVGMDFSSDYPAYPMEFPDMAALGYGKDENNTTWQCGGALISSRYILTSAHCVDIPSFGSVQRVRLGDLGLDKSDDIGQSQLLTVVNHVVHPQYKSPALYNDIALLQLDRDVMYNAYVRPACLNNQMDLLDSVGDVVGWKLTHPGTAINTNMMQTFTLPVQPGKECADIYKSLVGKAELRNGYDDTSMLCVGDKQGDIDTCEVDTGGHYHKKNSEKYPSCLQIISGVSSLGKTVCGAVSKPAIFTRVSSFIPWIESVVWPVTEEQQVQH